MIISLCTKCEKRPKHVGDLCNACYMRKYRNGGQEPSTPPKEYGATSTCHPERPHRAKGLCNECYIEKWKRDKGIIKRVKPTITCGHPEAKHHCHGMCKPCYLSSDFRKQQYADAMLDPLRRQRLSKQARTYNLKTRYGLTPEDYQRMFDAQDGKCALCLRPATEKRKLAVDHNHETGEVRKLLCIPCNRSVGYVENAEWIERARAYLSNPSTITYSTHNTIT